MNMQKNFDYKNKYLKYKTKYNELKNKYMIGGYNYNNFNLIKLDSSNKRTILENPLFNFNKEIKLVLLICDFLKSFKNINANAKIKLIDKIKDELFEITKLNDIKCMNNNKFIDKIFYNICDENNIKKQKNLFYNVYRENIYGANDMFEDGEFMRTDCIGNDCMFLNCIINKNLDSDSYIVYYIDKNYKMVMMVNNSNFVQLNPMSNVSEHIFIHKLPSTELLERIYGKKNNNMAIKLHKYAIQELKPNIVVSAPLKIMESVFEKLCDEQILSEISKDYMISFFSKGKKNAVEMKYGYNYIKTYGSDVFCYEPTKIYFVKKTDHIIS